LPTLSEAKRLVRAWAPDPITARRSDSIRYHFEEHGGADLWQYLRDARRVSLTLRGTGRPIPGRTLGVQGYQTKNGYIHISPRGIISFGYD